MGYGATLRPSNPLLESPSREVWPRTSVNPILALMAGWAFLNERLNARVGIAALLILGGVYLVNADYRRRLSLQRGLPAIPPENGGE